jgi:hypothetical protein
MHAMTASRWLTGTYELLIEVGETILDGDIGITIFAVPTDRHDRASDQDAPVLAQREVWAGEVGYPDGNVPWTGSLRHIGEQGLAPENIEAEFGGPLALRILLALFQAAERDFNGTDMQGRPWREPSAGAFPVMERAHDLMVMLTIRLAEM